MSNYKHCETRTNITGFYQKTKNFSFKSYRTAIFFMQSGNHIARVTKNESPFFHKLSVFTAYVYYGGGYETFCSQKWCLVKAICFILILRYATLKKFCCSKNEQFAFTTAARQLRNVVSKRCSVICGLRTNEAVCAVSNLHMFHL